MRDGGAAAASGGGAVLAAGGVDGAGRRGTQDGIGLELLVAHFWDLIFRIWSLDRGREGMAPGVFVRVASKGVAGSGVCKSGRERSYGRGTVRGRTKERRCFGGGRVREVDHGEW